MKLLVTLFAAIALCAGSAIPQVPGDNSHYVEGESRYIWMPDGEGTPHLVDLHAEPDMSVLKTRNGAANEYRLFTRNNPTTPEILVHGNPFTIWNSGWRWDRPIHFVVHGWNSNGAAEVNTLLTEAFLAADDCNVIVVDWSATANEVYTTAVAAVPGIGRFLGNFILFLFDNTAGNWSRIHLVGHNLGAHVVGAAGRQVDGMPWRVTGLDPSGPQWVGNANALSSNCGNYVETIHTDGDILGIMVPTSHTDFYPNGGRHPQPGCSTSTCSHNRAYELYASSIRTDHFVGRLCSNLDQAENNQCSGSALNMGNNDLFKRGSGLYSLSTDGVWPF